MTKHIATYGWASRRNVGKLNLTNHSKEIEQAIIVALPTAYNPVVSVRSDEFAVVTDKAITRGLARRIGRSIAKISSIGQLCKVYCYNKGRGRSKQIFRRLI